MNNNRPTILSCGEVLWDIIRDRQHIGGAPFNLAAHLAQLGCNARMLTRIGKDPRGDAALTEMQRLGVDRSLVQVDPDHPTGYATVQLSDQGAATYTFPPDPAYDFIDIDDTRLTQLTAAGFDAICFGTLQQKGEKTRQSLMRLLKSVPAGEKFFDVNIRMDFYPVDVLTDSLTLSTIVKLNEDESPLVARRLYGQALTEAELANRLLADFPIHTVCVTKGPHGCTILHRGHSQSLPVTEQITVADTVGAGDAFSAAFLRHFLITQDAFESGKRGNVLGAYVASKAGAVPRYDAGVLSRLDAAGSGDSGASHA